MKFGIQLYSVRKEIEERGLETMLQVIKNAGYDCVECAGFYGLSPEEMRKTLDKFGLKAFSAHLGAAAIEQTLPYIDELELERVYIPWVATEDFEGEKFEAVVETVQKAKALLDQRGVLLGYHNHAHEYKDGNDCVWKLVNAVPGVTVQMDIFWVAVAGLDPIELMDKYGDKLSCIHVKELAWEKSADGGFLHAIVGQGKSKSKEVIEKAVQTGIDAFILEVEGFPCDVEEYLVKSLDAMKAFAGVK